MRISEITPGCTTFLLEDEAGHSWRISHAAGGGISVALREPVSARYESSVTVEAPASNHFILRPGIEDLA